jgi:hypothetical protein
MATSHTWTLGSQGADASLISSGENATLLTGPEQNKPEPGLSIYSTRPVATSHTRIVQSSDPDPAYVAFERLSSPYDHVPHPDGPAP